MKKIIFAIIIISVATIVFCFIYIPNHTDRNSVLYRSLVTYEDVVYKTTSTGDLTLDILMPTEDVYSQIPVVFYVHGGSFIEGEKSDLTRDIGEDVTYTILSRGYAIVSMEYRLLDENTHFPANLKDIKDSIRYIRSVAGNEEYNFDTKNFGIWGSNAGAYLALTVGYSPSGVYIGDSNLQSVSAEVNYVIDFSGVSYLRAIYDINSMEATELDSAQTMLDYLFGPIYDIRHLPTEVEGEDLNEYDPLSYISDDTIPTLIIHGDDDTVVDISQSSYLTDKLDYYSVDYSYYEILAGNNGLTNIPDSEVENISNYVVIFLNTQYVN